MDAVERKRLAVVVEDDDALRWLICELLKAASFQTLGCRDGREGLEVARRLRPSVLTLDLHMPGMDGLEVLDRLSRDQGTAMLPVVVVSSYVPEPGVRFHRQVKAVVRKPFDVDELRETVRRAARAA